MMTSPTSSLLHPGRSRLIVLEGIDLSGRTTQVHLLRDWLEAQRYAVITTAWRTSPLIADVLVRARAGSPLQPLAYSLLYCADHIDRTHQVIKPALERGEIVIADRYIYTAFARDTARGLDSAWVRNLYRFSVRPDIVFYLHISPAEAVKRRMLLQQQRQSQALASAASYGQKDGKHSKDGKDNKKHKHKRRQGKKQLQSPTAVLPAPQLSLDALESFRNFENSMYIEYQQMQKEFDFIVIEGSQPIAQVQAALRSAIIQLSSAM